MDVSGMDIAVVGVLSLRLGWNFGDRKFAKILSGTAKFVGHCADLAGAR
jgi:hypothetical protein